MEKRKALRIISENKRNYNLISKEWAVSRFQPSPLKIKLLRSIRSGFKVLDLGCGNGLMAREVIRRGGKYIGLDVSAKLLAIARRKFVAEINPHTKMDMALIASCHGKKKIVINSRPDKCGLFGVGVKSGQVKFVLGDALKLPFKKNSFDFIFSFAVMHHIPSEELRLKFLSEINRVLKDKTSAVIVNWNLLNKWADKKYNISRQLKNPEKNFGSGDVRVPWLATKGKTVKRYIHIFNKKEIVNLARQAGFKEIKADYYNRAGELESNGEELVLRLKK